MLKTRRTTCCLCSFIKRNLHPLRPLSSSVHRTSTDVDDTEMKLSISVVGLPNVGKSTLINRIVGEKVSVVTARSHTTRRAVRGIRNIGNTQLIFTDTPGAVSYQEGRRLRMHKDHIRTPLRVTGLFLLSIQG